MWRGSQEIIPTTTIISELTSQDTTIRLSIYQHRNKLRLYLNYPCHTCSTCQTLFKDMDGVGMTRQRPHKSYSILPRTRNKAIITLGFLWPPHLPIAPKIIFDRSTRKRSINYAHGSRWRCLLWHFCWFSGVNSWAIVPWNNGSLFTRALSSQR